MINVTELKSGTTFTEDGNIFEVMSYEHTKMGRGTATIRVKTRNLRSGSIVEKTFISGARVQPIQLDKRTVGFLYKQGEEYIFMDHQTFEQFTLLEKNIIDEKHYLVDGTDVDILFYDEEPLKIMLPLKMEFTVTDTSPGVKGNSATNVWKDAILDNGMRVKVPMFIENGVRIRVNTRDGKYVERAAN